MHDEGISELFLSEVYRLALIVGLLISAALAIFEPFWALSFFIGGWVSLLSLRSLDFVIRRKMVPGQTRIKGSIGLLALIKYPSVALIFYILVKQSWLNAPALGGGLGLVYAVISLKVFWLAGVQLLRIGSHTSKM